MLDRHSVISLLETHLKKTTVQFIVTNSQLFYYLDQNPSVEKIVQHILRTYGGIFDLPTNINPLAIAKKIGTFEQKILDVLTQLQKDNIITLEGSDTDATITFLVPREDDKTINVISKLITQQNELKTQQITQVLRYVNNDKVCKSIQLLTYFDEKVNESCGICSVCLQKKSKISSDVLSIAKEEVLKCLKKAPLSSKELLENITFKEMYVLEALKELSSEEIISVNQINQYYIL